MCTAWHLCQPPSKLQLSRRLPKLHLARVLQRRHHPPSCCVLLERRPASGIWGGLWSFPECRPGQAPTRWCKQTFSIRATKSRTLPVSHHAFTHFVLKIQPQQLRVSAAAGARIGGHGRAWVRPGAPGRRGLAAPVQKLLEQLDSQS